MHSNTGMFFHIPARSAPRPSSGLRCNGLTRAVLLLFADSFQQSVTNFFGNQSGRHSAKGCCGGFQLTATPSLVRVLFAYSSRMRGILGWLALLYLHLFDFAIVKNRLSFLALIIGLCYPSLHTAYE